MFYSNVHSAVIRYTRCLRKIAIAVDFGKRLARLGQLGGRCNRFFRRGEEALRTETNLDWLHISEV